MATRVLMLVGDRKLDLDAPAYRYLPNVLNPQDHGAITVRMLLGHTNGLATCCRCSPAARTRCARPGSPTTRHANSSTWRGLRWCGRSGCGPASGAVRPHLR
ncbi:serine hydrolase [Nonomuraea africana]|uniref:serine hydrolase n=1 Tax=Nonomuraea africana TaxID=46171 RepID=UPI0033C06E51